MMTSTWNIWLMLFGFLLFIGFYNEGQFNDYSNKNLK